MAQGTIGIYLPHGSDGEPLRGAVPRHIMRTLPKSIEARTFYDPDADRNLSNALPTPAPKARKAPTAAPRGWSLMPGYVEPASEPVQVRVNGVTVATTRRIELAAPAVVPSALETCNACEVSPMVEPEHPGYAAGLCADCYAETQEPEPAPFALPEPVAPADALAPAPEPEPEPAAPAVAPEPEPIAAPAPVLTVVAPRERPTCERCGQTFRLGGSGYAWHVANRPDCAARRLAVVA